MYKSCLEIKKFTIKTFYSIETYFCSDIDDYLALICFCDNYDVIEERNANETELKRIEESYKALESYLNEYNEHLVLWYCKPYITGDSDLITCIEDFKQGQGI